jgi:AraC-like DNA-binding protein
VKATTISSWVLLIAKALESYGRDPDTVFRAAGLDPGRLRDPNARYPFRDVVRLWNQAVEITGDRCFGLEAANHWHPTTTHALGYAWMASSSLREALERAVRFSRIVSDASSLRLEDTNDGSCRLLLDYPDADVPPADASIDAVLALVIYMCRSSYVDDNFAPLEVGFRHRQPDCVHRFSVVFGAPVRFEADDNWIRFDRRQIERALPTANAELAHASDTIIAEYLARMDQDDIVLQVRRALVTRLCGGQTTEAGIAESLHLTPRTLQRRLKAAGTTYKAVLEETRRHLALDFVRNSRYSIGEITYLLGFSEASNFSRAFKRWTGLSPSAFRERMRTQS